MAINQFSFFLDAKMMFLGDITDIHKIKYNGYKSVVPTEQMIKPTGGESLPNTFATFQETFWSFRPMV
jgi:hypothetical protein